MTAVSTSGHDTTPEDPSAPLAIGVDVGGTTTRVGVVDRSGAILDLVSTPTPAGADPLATHLVEQIDSMRRRHDGQVAVIGVGVPGRIDPATRMLSTALNLDIVEPTPLWDRLERGLDLPIELGNDVDHAALGAYVDLAGGRGSLVYLSMGTGLASGLVLDGALHRGLGGAGEIGHLRVPGGDRACPCGQVGCAETMASGRAMLTRWGRPDGDIAGLWDAADAGDQLADAVRESCVDTLAWLVTCSVLMLDVDTVALGGGVSRLGERLRAPIRERLAAAGSASPFIASYAPGGRVRLAPPDAEYGVVGAAAAARSADRARTGGVAP